MDLQLKQSDSMEPVRQKDTYEAIVTTLDTLGNDADILAAFNESFDYIPDLASKDQLVHAIILSEELRLWFLKYVESRTTSIRKPVWLPNNSTGLNHWMTMQGLLEPHNKKLREWDRSSQNAVQELVKRTNSINNEKRRYFKNAHPLIIIHSLTVQNLSAQNIIDLVLITDLQLREEKQERLINEMKESYYNEWTNNQFDNPFL